MKYFLHYCFAKGYGPIWVWFHDRGIKLKGELQIAKSTFYVLYRYRLRLIQDILLMDNSEIRSNPVLAAKCMEKVRLVNNLTNNLETLTNAYNLNNNLSKNL
jgi:hypothetical protein